MIRSLAALALTPTRAALVASLATAPALAQVQPSAPVASKGYVDTGLAAGIAAIALEKARAQAAEGLLLPKAGGMMTGPVVLAAGSTGPVDGMSVTPNASAATGTLARLLAARAPLANPTFTGAVTAPIMNAQSNNYPRIQLFDVAAPANVGRWDWIAAPDGSMHMRAVSDDYSTASDVLSVQRSGAFINRIQFGPAVPNAANIPARVAAEIGGGQNAFLGSVTNDKGACVAGSPTNCAFPTGVTGYGNLPSTSPGNTVFGLLGRADCRTAGICTNEVNSFNFNADAAVAYPFDRAFGTASTVPVALTVAAGGPYKSAAAIDIGREGEVPGQFQNGIGIRADGVVQSGLVIDATSTTGPVNNIVLRNTGQGSNVFLDMQTMGSAVASNLVIRHRTAVGVPTFAVTQGGDVSGAGVGTFGVLLAQSANYPSARISNASGATDAKQWEWIVFPDGSLRLRADSDSYMASTDVIVVTRSGTTPTGISIKAPTLTSAFIRTADPTTSDIPTGQCADWNNTTAGTYKHVCNFGGTLRSVTMN